MSKITRFVGLIAVLAALILSVAYLPSTVSASHGGWGLMTVTDKDTNPNPNAHFINLCGYTGMDPSRMFEWDPFTYGYFMCFVYSNGNYIPTGYFQYSVGRAAWIQFAYPYETAVNNKYQHFPEAYVYRPGLLAPGWNMAGSPYAVTGYYDAYGQPTYIQGTPLDCFQFRLPNDTTWYNYYQAKSSGWITSTWWWNCMNMTNGQEDPKYFKIGDGLNDWLPEAHGCWIYATTNLVMRIARPPGIKPTYTGLSTTKAPGTGISGLPDMQGAPPSPY